MLPYLLIFLAFWLAFSFNGGKCLSKAVLSVFCLWGGYESMTGLMQLAGFAVSGHPGYAMTGTFANPGPYGGFMAMPLAAGTAYLLDRGSLLFKGKVADIVYDAVISLSVFLGILVLPATMSRAGWMGFIVAVALSLWKGGWFRRWMSGRKWLQAAVAVMAMVCLAGIFSLKIESAMGRLHIWRIEVRAIASGSFFGSGPGTVLGEYGRAQEEFFREKERDDATVRIAGCPEYAFNEYLGAGIEYGIPGLLISLVIPAFAMRNLIRRREPLGYALAALCVFAFFSYPMSLWQFRVCLAALLGAGFSLEREPVAGCSGCCRLSLPSGKDISRRIALYVVSMAFLAVSGILLHMDIKSETETGREWEEAEYWSITGLYEDSAEALMPLYDRLKDNYRYLYDLGYALHKAGRYDESNAILEQGAKISCDPMFHNIIGKNHEAMGDCVNAEKEFWKAHYMVPSRLYPLTLLMDMYIRQGRTGDAAAMGDRIMSMPVNSRNRTMSGLMEETKEKTDSLRKIKSYEKDIVQYD